MPGGAVRLLVRHVIGAAGVLVAGLFPVRAGYPVPAAAGLGVEAQLVRPALGIGVVLVVLQRYPAAGEGRAAVGRITQAGEPLLPSRGGRIRAVGGCNVLHVLRILVPAPRRQRPVGAGEDEVRDADIAVHVQLADLHLVAEELRAEARHLARPVVRVLVPRTQGAQALILVGERGTPALVQHASDRD